MANPLRIKIILGSTRPGRFSEKPGAWMLGHLAERADVEAEVLDLREYPMPFFNEPVSPSAKKEPYADPNVAKWTAKIADGDAFVIVAPEYNHGYSAVLKNAIDYVSVEWNNKPVAFVAYGSAMGARAVEQMREVAIELQMAPIRNAIQLPWDVVAAPDAAQALARYDERANGLIDQLLWWAHALKAARSASFAS